jgi:hypothetical protein
VRLDHYDLVVQTQLNDIVEIVGRLRKTDAPTMKEDYGDEFDAHDAHLSVWLSWVKSFVSFHETTGNPNFGFYFRGNLESRAEFLKGLPVNKRTRARHLVLNGGMSIAAWRRDKNVTAENISWYLARMLGPMSGWMLHTMDLEDMREALEKFTEGLLSFFD